jgi:hypothetical protein
MSSSHNYRTGLLAGSALLAVMLLTSCGVKTPEDEFFPLQAGRSWTYRVTKTMVEKGEPQYDSLTLDTRGSESVNGVFAMRRHSDSGVDYWLRSDDTGVYRVASKNALESEPKTDEPLRYVLRKPFVVGTRWDALTVAYIMEHRNESRKEVRYTHKPINMVYHIDALDQKVTTIAGSFEGCIKVIGEAQIKLFADDVFNFRDVPLFSHEWYCPKVGLVRLQRLEASPSKFILGGTTLLELTRWK